MAEIDLMEEQFHIIIFVVLVVAESWILISNRWISLNETAGKNFDGIIENHSMMFYGTCNECS